MSGTGPPSKLERLKNTEARLMTSFLVFLENLKYSIFGFLSRLFLAKKSSQSRPRIRNFQSGIAATNSGKCSRPLRDPYFDANTTVLGSLEIL